MYLGRMERYQEMGGSKPRKSRVIKNQDLYQDLGRTEKYTTFTEIPKIEAVELSATSKNYRTREGYHQYRDYPFQEEQKPFAKKELEELDLLYHLDHNKNYDINTVLKEARALREKDALERKRKLPNEKYNILESSEDELERFKQEKERKIKPVENEEALEELIHTITSKELREQIDQQESKTSLLNDLMATNVHDEVVAAYREEEKTPPKEESPVSHIDESFYTKSMDLSEEDFDSEEEVIKSTPKIIILLRIVFSLLLIGAVGAGIYYVLTNF